MFIPLPKLWIFKSQKLLLNFFNRSWSHVSLKQIQSFENVKRLREIFWLIVLIKLNFFISSFVWTIILLLFSLFFSLSLPLSLFLSLLFLLSLLLLLLLLLSLSLFLTLSFLLLFFGSVLLFLLFLQYGFRFSFLLKLNLWLFANFSH